MHIGCNTGSCALPDMSVLAHGTCSALRPCIYISGNALMSVLQPLHVCMYLSVLQLISWLHHHIKTLCNHLVTRSSVFKKFHCDFKFIHCYYIAIYNAGLKFLSIISCYNLEHSLVPKSYSISLLFVAVKDRSLLTI